MSAAVNREASRNVVRRASQMIDKASLAQRSVSAAIDFGDDFSRQSTQAIDNYDNFDQTIMDSETSRIEDPVYQAPQPANHYGATKEETRSQCYRYVNDWNIGTEARRHAAWIESRIGYSGM